MEPSRGKEIKYKRDLLENIKKVPNFLGSGLPQCKM